MNSTPSAVKRDRFPWLTSVSARCAICQRRLGKTAFYLEEDADIPDPRQSWTLCSDCNEAVAQQLRHVAVRTPLRLRVAVGVVASERSPAARSGRWEGPDDKWVERFLIGVFLAVFAIHALVFILVVIVVARH